MLLVLDNFEQFVPVAGILQQILSEAPDVKALVTSRERLDVADESVFRVIGLAYPDDGGQSYRAVEKNEIPAGERGIELAAFDSLALFGRVAGQLDPNFRISADLEAVARICRLVEGLPLAIEMIAPWTLTMSLAAIADRISTDMPDLLGSTRNFPERHRSLHIVFEHSWNLLTQAEQRVVRRLAVIVGNISPAAADAIAGATEPILQSLARKSMLDRLDEEHYILHSLLRAFALQKLREAGELEKVQAAHFAYFSYFVESRLPELRGADQLLALQQLEGAFDNIRATWQYGVEKADGDQLMPLMRGVYDLCTTRSWYAMGIEISMAGKEALKRRDMNRLVGHLLLNEALMHHHMGNYDQARLRIEEGQILCEREGDIRGVAKALFLSGTIQYDSNQYDEAERLITESAGLSRVANDWEAVADWHLMMGHITDLRTVFSPQGKVRYKPPRPFFFEHYWPTAEQMEGAEKAIAHFKEALRLYSEIGQLHKVAWCRGAIGQPCYRLHQYDAAANCYREAAELLSKLNAMSDMVQCLNWLAWVLHMQDKLDEARQNFHEALRLGISVFAVKRLLDCLQKYSLFMWKTERSHFTPLAINTFVVQHPNTDGRMRVVAQEWVENISDFMLEDEGQEAVDKAIAYGRQQTLSNLVYSLLSE